VTAAPAISPRLPFTVDKRRVGDVLVVSITGRITEDFDGPAIARELFGLVVIDLEKATGITSFAVRSWVDMLTEARPRLSGLYFARVSQSMTRQMNMVRNFTGGGLVLSFYAPYSCPQCEIFYERLFDCARDADFLRRLEAPPAACPRCGLDGELDDDPASCFAVAANQAIGEVPASVRQVVDALGSSAEPSLRPPSRVEKTVEGRVTRLQINGRLDHTLRWERITEGLQGHVVFDLSGVSEVLGIGVTNLHKTLQALPLEVPAVFLESCPLPLIERIAGAPRIERLTVLSAVLQAVCASCKDIRSKLVDVRRGAEALRRGQSTFPCDRCGGALTFTKVMPLVRYLTSQPMLELPETGAAAPPQRDVRAPIGPLGRLLLGAAGGVVIVLLTAIVILLARDPVGTAVPPAEVPAGPARAAPAERGTSAAADPAAPGPSQTAARAARPDDLPPPWAEQEPVYEGETLFVAGRGGPAPTADAALALARNVATVHLSEEVLRQLGGTLLYEHVMACCAPRPGQPHDPAGAQRVAERFRAEVGALAVLERADAAVRAVPGGFEAFARYRISRAAVAAATEEFRTASTFKGLTVAPVFPLVAEDGEPASHALVVAVRPRSAADAAGARVGDAVVEVNGRRIVTASDFQLVAAAEWKRTVPGRRLAIVLDRAGTRRPIGFLRPEPRPRVDVR